MRYILIHIKKISSKQPNFIPQETRKEQPKLKVCRKNKITKIRAEINDIEVRKIIEKNQGNKKLCLF